MLWQYKGDHILKWENYSFIALILNHIIVQSFYVTLTEYLLWLAVNANIFQIVSIQCCVQGCNSKNRHVFLVISLRLSSLVFKKHICSPIYWKLWVENAVWYFKNSLGSTWRSQDEREVGGSPQTFTKTVQNHVLLWSCTHAEHRGNNSCPSR